VRSGKLNQNEVPAEGASGNESFADQQPQQQQQQQQQYNYNQQQSGNLSNFSPNQLGQAYRPYGNQQNDFGPQSYMDRAKEQARMEEAESFDSNAGIHGNWTLENAKSKLNQFMQANKIPGEFKYSAIGPDHNR
jgi:ATP-dependent RNA helicase A